MGKTFGQTLDEWTGKKWPEVIIMYKNKDNTPHITVTHGESNYDWQDIITQDHNLLLEIDAKKAEVKALQNKIRRLEKSKRDVEKAITLLTTPAKLTHNREEGA